MRRVSCVVTGGTSRLRSADSFEPFSAWMTCRISIIQTTEIEEPSYLSLRMLPHRHFCFPNLGRRCCFRSQEVATAVVPRSILSKGSGTERRKGGLEPPLRSVSAFHWNDTVCLAFCGIIPHRFSVGGTVMSGVGAFQHEFTHSAARLADFSPAGVRTHLLSSWLTSLYDANFFMLRSTFDL